MTGGNFFLKETIDKYKVKLVGGGSSRREEKMLLLRNLHVHHAIMHMRVALFNTCLATTINHGVSLWSRISSFGSTLEVFSQQWKPLTSVRLRLQHKITTFSKFSAELT